MESFQKKFPFKGLLGQSSSYEFNCHGRSLTLFMPSIVATTVLHVAAIAGEQKLTDTVVTDADRTEDSRRQG